MLFAGHDDLDGNGANVPLCRDLDQNYLYMSVVYYHDWWLRERQYPCDSLGTLASGQMNLLKLVGASSIFDTTTLSA